MVEDCTITPVALAAGEGERISLLGAEMIFKSPLGSEDGWVALDYTLPAKHFGAPLHYHKNITESFYVVSGEVWFRVGDKEITLQPGGFALVPPGTPHAFSNRSDAPARLFAHASSARQKRFLEELFSMVEAEQSWPPQDRSALVELGRRYDTVYL